jgi:hypothetical protein
MCQSTQPLSASCRWPCHPRPKEHALAGRSGHRRSSRLQIDGLTYGKRFDVGSSLLAKRGVRLLTASGDDLTDSDRKMMRSGRRRVHGI